MVAISDLTKLGVLLLYLKQKIIINASRCVCSVPTYTRPPREKNDKLPFMYK